VTHVLDDAWDVELIRGDENFTSVVHLDFCLTIVITFPMELSSCNFNKFVEVETSWENTQDIDEHLKVIKISIDTVCDTCILHLERNLLSISENTLVDLANTGGGEREKVNFLEVFLPLRAVCPFKVPHNLLYGHDVGLRAGFLHCVTNDWRQN